MDQMANLNESVTLMPDAADFGNHSISTMRPPIDPALVRFRDDSRFWVQRVRPIFLCPYLSLQLD